jgi:membrane associated rhomboid family serine protease
VIPIRDLNPRRITPVVNIALIVINVLFFFYELSLGQRIEGFLFQSAFVPARIFEDRVLYPSEIVWGLQSGLLSMFLHGGWGHLLGNMLFLWVFGDNVEDRLGHFRYLIFYLAAGYAATAAHALAGPHSTLPAIGASGAISGVLGAYLFLHPRSRILTLVFLGFFIQTIEVPALVFLPIWFLIQFISGVSSLGVPEAQSGGVAWFAHIGGFIAGPILLFLLGGWRKRPPRREERPGLWA